MFRRFASNIPDGANQLFLLHPVHLHALVELAWNARLHVRDQPLGHPAHRSNIPGLPLLALGSPLAPLIIGNGDRDDDNTKHDGTVRWEHLVYAYMIENTRVFEIFRRVLDEFLHGERLGTANSASQHWLRNTEALLYRDPPSFFVAALTSSLRPDDAATRRNLYKRLLGMELNQGRDDGGPVDFVRAEAVNNELTATFEDLLHEVWIGIINVDNNSGSNPTDDAKIADLAEKMHDMLRARRQNGTLSPEEFVAVTKASWLHLTLESNFPIIETLRAEATSPEQRLFKIAERVGLPAHGLAKSFFDIADPISRILIQIETGTYNNADAASALYSQADNGPEADMRTIIRHWSTITGRDVKAGKVAATA
jgi:hypothetical protein